LFYFQYQKPEIAAVISTFLEKWKKDYDYDDDDDYEETDSNSSDLDQDPDSME
jgi:hypothetical protein